MTLWRRDCTAVQCVTDLSGGN